MKKADVNDVGYRIELRNREANIFLLTEGKNLVGI
jgi:hypothetical protein